jgi:hypothetical protein
MASDVACAGQQSLNIVMVIGLFVTIVVLS